MYGSSIMFDIRAVYSAAPQVEMRTC